MNAIFCLGAGLLWSILGVIRIIQGDSDVGSVTLGLGILYLWITILLVDED